jgi:uncharacterized protein (DUF111 family)
MYVPTRSGFGAGTKDPHGRPNALRIVLADAVARDGEGSGVQAELLVLLSADMDDMDGEQISGVADRLRGEGALDVVLVPTVMKKGRPGIRIDVLCTPARADSLEAALFLHGSSIGIRRTPVERRALPRVEHTVCVLDHEVRVKVVTLPSGGERAKPEFEDVARVALATGRPHRDVAALAREAAERLVKQRVSRPAS